MANNADLVLLGATGVGSVAPLGTTAPTDASASLNVAFKSVGYISDNGLTKGRAESRKDFTPWQSRSPIRTQITSSVKTFKVECWESNATVLSLYYRGGVITPSSAGLMSIAETDVPSPDLRAWVFDVADGVNLVRHYVARGEVTDTGDITYKADEIVTYPLTITAYPGSDGISIHHYYLMNALATP